MVSTARRYLPDTRALERTPGGKDDVWRRAKARARRSAQEAARQSAVSGRGTAHPGVRSRSGHACRRHRISGITTTTRSVSCSSLKRSRATRSERPELARQTVIWGVAGGAAWLAACVAVRQRTELKLPALAGLAWWLSEWRMLGWHLGMAEESHGRPHAGLSPADAVTLTRFWLVPALPAAARHAAGLPAVIALGGATDWLDGAVARRHGRTRLGRDLDSTADLLSSPPPRSAPTVPDGSRGTGSLPWLGATGSGSGSRSVRCSAARDVRRFVRGGGAPSCGSAGSWSARPAGQGSAGRCSWWAVSSHPVPPRPPLTGVTTRSRRTKR